MPQASAAPGPCRLASALLVLAPAPAATRFQLAAARLLTEVEHELLTPRASAQTTSRVSHETKRHLLGGRRNQLHPIDTKAAAAREHRKAFSSALPFSRGEGTDLPKIVQQEIRASNKMREAWYQSHLPVTIGLPLPEAFEGTVAHQSSIITHTMPQSMQLWAKMILEWAVSPREVCPELVKLFLENNMYTKLSALRPHCTKHVSFPHI